MAGTASVLLVKITSRIILKDILDDRFTKATVILLAFIIALVSISIFSALPEQYPRFGFSIIIIVMGLAIAEGLFLFFLIIRLVGRYNG